MSRHAVAPLHNNLRRTSENLQQGHLLRHRHSPLHRLRPRSLVRAQPLAPQQKARPAHARPLDHCHHNHVPVRVRRLRRLFHSSLLVLIRKKKFMQKF